MKFLYSHLLRITIIVLLLFILHSSMDSFALAQSNPLDLTMKASAAFDGHFKYGEWLPIVVELENDGDDFEAEIRVNVAANASTTTYVTPVSLPSNSRKRVFTYVVPNNFTRQLEVRLVSEEQLIASQTINIEPHPPIDYLIGIFASERGALTLLGSVELPGTERQKSILDLSLIEIPDKYEGLRSFDLLIFNDIDTAHLTSDQQKSLETWVDQGGRLVIGGGANAQITLQGLPESLRIFEPSGSTELSFPDSLEIFTGETQPIRVPGPFVITTGTFITGNSLADQDGLPLVVENLVGNGYIDFIALDLTSSPFDAWSGTTSFWRRLIATGTIYSYWQPSDTSMRQQIAAQMPYSLSNLPILDLPSAQGLAALLAIYILTVGPLNYGILRWQKRLHWAWFTIPIITIIFSIGAFSLGYLLHGTDLFVNKIAIVKLQPNGRAHVTSYLGLFSPSRSTYQVEITEGGLVSSLDPYVNPWDSFNNSSGLGSSREKIIVQGNPSFIQGINVDQWSMQSFMVEGNTIEFGKVTSELFIENNTLVGTIHNDSSHMLSGAMLVLDKRYQYLGDLESGTTSNVNINIDNLSQPDPGPPLSYLLIENQLGYETMSGGSPMIEARRNILDSIFSRGTVSLMGSDNDLQAHFPVLIGWIDEAPPTIKIDGKSPSQQTTALFYMPLSYQFPQTGIINIPVGLIPGLLIEAKPYGNPCGEPGTTSIYLEQAEAIFEFILPSNVSEDAIDIENLKLSIWSDAGWNAPPITEFYDWNNKIWQKVEITNQGINLVSPAENFVRSDGVIHLRINTADITPSCYFIGLGMEAHS